MVSLTTNLSCNAIDYVYCHVITDIFSYTNITGESLIIQISCHLKPKLPNIFVVSTYCYT